MSMLRRISNTHLCNRLISPRARPCPGLDSLMRNPICLTQCQCVDKWDTSMPRTSNLTRNIRLTCPCHCISGHIRRPRTLLRQALRLRTSTRTALRPCRQTCVVDPWRCSISRCGEVGKGEVGEDMPGMGHLQKISRAGCISLDIRVKGDTGHRRVRQGRFKGKDKGMDISARLGVETSDMHQRQP